MNKIFVLVKKYLCLSTHIQKKRIEKEEYKKCLVSLDIVRVNDENWIGLFVER